MKLFKKILSTTLSFGMIFCSAFSLRVFAGGDKSTPTNCVLEIPQTLEECCLALDDRFREREDIKEKIRTASDTDLWRFHMGLGLWIRNNWLYPCENGKICQFLQDNGCDCIDTASCLIIENYRNYLLTGKSAANAKDLVIDHEFKNRSRFDESLTREKIEEIIMQRITYFAYLKKPRAAKLACTLL